MYEDEGKDTRRKGKEYKILVIIVFVLFFSSFYGLTNLYKKKALRYVTVACMDAFVQ